MIRSLTLRGPLSLCRQDPPSSDDLLDSFPGGGGIPVDSGKPRPIGVPEFVRDPNDPDKLIPFTANVRESYGDPLLVRFGEGGTAATGATLRPQAPRYWTGAELEPGNWHPARRADLQTALVHAGLIGKDETFTLGEWDAVSRRAFTELLKRANASGLTWLEQLSSAEQAPQITEPLQIQLTNPEDLRRVFKEAAFQVSATQFDPGQIDAMVAAYHEKERAYQEAKARGDEELFAPPDPGTFVESEAERVNPEGVLERDVQQAEDAWLSAIGTMGDG